MNIRIAMIVACAGTFALAQNDLAQAAYPGSDVSIGMERTAGMKTVLADNTTTTTTTTVHKHRHFRAYPCEDYNPVKQKIKRNPEGEVDHRIEAAGENVTSRPRGVAARLPLRIAGEGGSAMTSIRALEAALLCGVMMTGPALAAEVTPERLINADKEPQNWLMNHRTYDGQRFSPLDRINRQNVKSLHVAYAVALGGSAASENIEATPLVEDGFLYIVDDWGIVYKIDVRSGDAGHIVWHMDPKLGEARRYGRTAASRSWATM